MSLFVALPLSGLDRAGVDVDRGHIGKEHAHDRTWFIFVASGDAEAAVHLMAAPADLVAVRDTFARWSEKRMPSVPIPMPSLPVGPPIVCGLVPIASSSAIARSMSGWMPALHGFIVECRLRTPDDRLAPVTVLEVDSTEHGASWRTGITVGDDVRTSVEFLVQFQLPWFASNNKNPQNGLVL